MTAPHSNPVVGALSMALAAGTREAFEELLTEDVRWGGEHGGNECRTRTEAGDHYAGLLAAGVRLGIADLAVGDDGLTARLTVAAGDPDEFPAEVTVRFTLRDGRIADIRELDPPPKVELLSFESEAVDAVHTGDVATLQQLLNDRPDLATARLARHGGVRSFTSQPIGPATSPTSPPR